MQNKRVVLFGPGPQFKGGISNYNTSLAKALEKQGAEVHIVSWTQQYPAIIPRDFIDRSSSKDFLEGTSITVQYTCNYNNPLSWAKTVRIVKGLKPDMIIFQWAIALQGLPMGWMARRLRKSGIEVIFDLHLVVQKEASSIDRFFTRYGLKTPETFITHAYKTVDELKSTFPHTKYTVNETGERVKGRTVIKLYHPIYDLYEPDPEFDVAAFKRELGLKQHVFLFFGFIRKYKGLHQALEAFAKLTKKRDDVSLLVVGESFWKTLDQKKWSTRLKSTLFGLAKRIFLRNSDNEQDYNPLALVEKLGIENDVKVFNQFVPNEEVPPYFQVSDAILLFYLTATPSGVESLSYNFKLPVLATGVGHFPETIKDGYNGYLAEPGDTDSMCEVMNKSINFPISRDHVAESARKMSWENYAKAILQNN